VTLETHSQRDEIILRPLIASDFSKLVQIRPTYTTSTILAVERSGGDLTVNWRLVERTLPQPFDKGTLYDFDEEAQAAIRDRASRPAGTYQRVAELSGRLIGLVDVELQPWNDTAFLWSLYIDQDYRRQGLGRRLWHRAIDFARYFDVRAMMIETQNTNIAACIFYARMGCQLVGINEALYTNDGYNTEIALFWAYYFT
jgi:ribosomal protein S18 acetylase RimI-like enzyme